jgi:hypothetical protein
VLQLDGPESRISTTCGLRGEFIFTRVTPGFHEVSIVPSTATGIASRVVNAYVDPGMHASMGPITLLPGTPIELSVPTDYVMPWKGK